MRLCKDSVFIRLRLLALFLMTLVPSQVIAGQPIQIVLNQQTTVDSETYTLGQVANIVTNDPQMAQTLQTFEIGASPLPGQSAWLHQAVVEQKLKKGGFDSTLFRITSQGPAKVLRGYHTADAEQIVQAVRSFIEQNAPWDPSQMKIRPIAYRQEHRLAPGKVTFQVSAPKHTDWLGAESFSVVIFVDGQISRKASVPVFIEVWGDVALTAKPLGRGQPIEASDVRIEKMNLARVPANAVVQADQLIGQRATRSIAANTILRSDQVEFAPAVRKGDIVQVLAETLFLKIATQAMAQENGAKGERIALINLTSKKTIYAHVVDSRTVKVQF